MVRMRRLLALLVAALIGVPTSSAPRLIVVVSLDQFRQDYLVRFGEHFGRGGFRLLMEQGAYFTGATFKHARNVTGPGHAVLLSGAYGWANGIVMNSWFDAPSGRSVYCVGDPDSRQVGAPGEGRSPVHAVGATFGDQLRLHTGFAGKVISVSLKDRAAVLMGGRTANGAYWMADSLFVSSTYYMSALPRWVEEFNRSGAVQAFWGRTWDRSLPAAAYRLMDRDDAEYEWGGLGLGRTFPRRITGDDPSARTVSYYDALRESPFGLDLLADFALAAVDAEELGRDDVPDLLCVGFSSTDYAGHAFGPHSQEMLDMVVRADGVLERFLSALDSRVGLRNVLVVLTSDHGVAPIPEYLQRHAPSLGAARISPRHYRETCDRVLAGAYGRPPGKESWIVRHGHGTVYLDRPALQSRGVDPDAAARLLADSLVRWPGVAAAISVKDLVTTGTRTTLLEKLRRSWYPGRVGDVVFVLKPFMVLDDGSEGADHGSPYDYDAHVPLIFFGPGVRAGTYARDVSPVDLAPTLSALTGIEFPAGRDGQVLIEAIAP